MKGSRRPVIAGNWKLHNTVAESVALCRALRTRLAAPSDTEVIVSPVFTALRAVADALEASRIRVAAQDVYWENKGAFTGEVGALLLKDAGCSHCIVGHSERRQLFLETDATVQQKTVALLDVGLVPIVCVGETLDEREKGETLVTVGGQIDRSLEGLTAEQAGRVVVAYEPVWAIGTGRTASAKDAQEVHVAIRERLGNRFGSAVASGMRILYGGSVKPDNARALLGAPDIDGALVGGASLNADSFVAIVEAAAF